MATINLTSDKFGETIESNDLVLIDFWASWCGPCRQFGPIFEQVSDEHPDAVFAKVNTEEERELSGALGIRSIPTLMIFREGVLIYSQPGALPATALRDVLTKVKALDMVEVHKQVARARETKAKAAEA